MHQLSGIPDSQLQSVLNDLLIDGFVLVSKFRSADGTWTVIAKPGTVAGPATAGTAHVATAVVGTVASGLSAAGSASITHSVIDVEKVDRDLSKLHPVMRKAAEKLQKAMDDEGIPLKAFEAYREPERQAHLYAKGRTTGGSIVTNAKPWESYHQYGLAVDFVRFENGGWNWNDSTLEQKEQWKRFHELASAIGLEPLSFEKPHVQVVGTRFANLLNGQYPDGGDEDWSANLSRSIDRWTGTPKPPRPTTERPPIEVFAELRQLTSQTSSGWHSLFGGDEWRYDATGVRTRGAGGEKVWRTAGSPLTVQEILARFADQIRVAAIRHRVSPALIVMTIATETAAFRKDGFTGRRTFRWEAGYLVNATGDPALDGVKRGDYSAGPMQVLSDTARWMNATKALGHDSAALFPFFRSKAEATVDQLGLYDAAVCIDVGTAYIAQNMPSTGDDPLLVAAAYNAGSLKPSAENHWRIGSHGNHIDRAAEWYGDACAVINGTA
jgi:peptidoglycan L-alanyl-D-glutamate endopeptidase CwlK